MTAKYALADRVIETTTTTGTGTITLAGAITQAQSFATGVGTGNTTDYCILSGDGTNWEVGTGVLGGSGPYTLTRTPTASSNSGSLISLSGTSTVFCTARAGRIAAPPPVQVQVATASGYASGVSYSQSVTFASTPTVGNLLVFICTGFKGGWKPPAGVVPIGGVIAGGTSAPATVFNYTAAQSYQGDSNEDNKQIAVFVKPVVSGDGTTWTFTISQDVFNVVALEYSGAGTVDMKAMTAGTPTSSSVTVYCPMAAALVQNELVWAVFATDTGSITVTNPANYTVQYQLQPSGHAFNEGVYATRNTSLVPGTQDVPSFACTGVSTSQVLLSATVRIIPPSY